MSNYDTHAGRDLHPVGRRLAEREQSPVDLLLLAAGLLEQHGHASSECRSTADKLRRLVRSLAAAHGGR
jgi:hypothetical protein